MLLRLRDDGNFAIALELPLGSYPGSDEKPTVRKVTSLIPATSR